MARVVSDVVFVDGVRTPFGKAGSALAETRADAYRGHTPVMHDLPT